MKLLILSNNPLRPSYRQRIEGFLPFLLERGVDADVYKLPQKKLQRWLLFRSARNYDAVLLHKKCLNFIDANMLRRYSRKIIYDFDDAIMYSPTHPDSDNTSHFRLFRRTATMVDVIIAGNEYLAQHAFRFCSNVHIVPTSLDIEPYHMSADKKEDTIRLVWIGSQSTLKYLKQLKPALEVLGQQNKNLKLRIIADDFFDLENMVVEKHSWSLETQVDDLCQCDIALAPLPDNRFTRGKCGFKILQYFAAGLPVVASPVGVNQTLIHQSGAGGTATTSRQWQDSIQQLVRDASLRRDMSQRGPDYVKQFDTSVVGNRFCDVIIQAMVPSVFGNSKQLNQTPKVSVCIPTYNRKEYLRQALESVSQQTYTDFEVIVFNDGSTDGTEKIVDQFDFPIRYYQQPNQGQPQAYNRLAELAKGDYIFFLDSDDIFYADSLQRLMCAVNVYPDAIVYGSYVRIDEDGAERGQNNKVLYSGDITEKLFQKIFVHCVCTMFPRKIFQEQGGLNQDYRVCFDYDMNLRLSLRYPYVAVDGPTFKRRRHASNMSKYNYKNHMTEFKVLEDFYFKKGGRQKIKKKVALRRLARQACRAGKCAIAEKKINEAKQILQKSLNYRFSLKAWWLLFRANLFD